MGILDLNILDLVIIEDILLDKIQELRNFDDDDDANEVQDVLDRLQF